ncbi:RECEPTOR-LIKE PROTEIN KINASE FERONIA [Salix koriyanagi]|uniref:RECEPTOR-LIKE PROTEIN KINASE FERONIA n=1 Tax=Salix koriyanagi TaxID=2511006 RepID=A0A9Q1AI62_9ROSI|nr:RECEPTOR-LIKE PROTEIN KINASE FERONIA [Salix koriyanagi]
METQVLLKSEVEVKSSLLEPAYAAPLQVYTSARTILQTTESKYRARWEFPVDYGSTNGSSAKYGGPILNGLEIFKLSDFSSNLAGPHPFGVIAAPHSYFSVRDDAGKACYGDSCTGSRWSSDCLLGNWTSRLRLFIFLLNQIGSKNPLSKINHQGYCRIFTIAEIKSATNNFADGLLIGTGGFGTVYKGSIDGGITSIAVKRANRNSHQGLKEFQTEISLLSNAQAQPPGKIAPDSFKTFAGIARKCLADRGSERPTMGDVLWNLELAMQQHEVVGGQEVSRVQKEANGTMNGDLRIMIDNHRCSGFDISDPNPGVEFSDIMVPNRTLTRSCSFSTSGRPLYGSIFSLYIYVVPVLSSSSSCIILVGIN